MIRRQPRSTRTYTLFPYTTLFRSGLLLDINNVEVSAFNLGLDPVAWLDTFDPRLVGEIHVAGHAVKDDDMGGPIAIDDPGSPVRARCWDLLARFLDRGGSQPEIGWGTDRERGVTTSVRLGVAVTSRK